MTHPFWHMLSRWAVEQDLGSPYKNLERGSIETVDSRRFCMFWIMHNRWYFNHVEYIYILLCTKRLTSEDVICSKKKPPGGKKPGVSFDQIQNVIQVQCWIYNGSVSITKKNVLIHFLSLHSVCLLSYFKIWLEKWPILFHPIGIPTTFFAMEKSTSTLTSLKASCIR